MFMVDSLGCIAKQDYGEELPPPEDRVYIKPEDIPKLPKGLIIYRGPRGGLCYSRRQYKELTGKEPDIGVAHEDRKRKEDDYEVKVNVLEVVDKLKNIAGSKVWKGKIVYEPELQVMIGREEPEVSEDFEFISFDAVVKVSERWKAEGDFEETEGKLLRDWAEICKYVKEQAITTLGMDEKDAEWFAKAWTIWRAWCSTDFGKVAGVLEEYIHEIEGDDRPVRKINRDAKKVFRDELGVTSEDISKYAKFIRQFLVSNEKIKEMVEKYGGLVLYRGISDYEIEQLNDILNGMMKKWIDEDVIDTEVRLMGTLYSFSLDANLAGYFGNKVIRCVVPLEQVYSCWFNANANNLFEEEVVVSVPKSGLKFDKIYEVKHRGPLHDLIGAHCTFAEDPVMELIGSIKRIAKDGTITGSDVLTLVATVEDETYRLDYDTLCRFFGKVVAKYYGGDISNLRKSVSEEVYRNLLYAVARTKVKIVRSKDEQEAEKKIIEYARKYSGGGD